MDAEISQFEIKVLSSLSYIYQLNCNNENTTKTCNNTYL